MTPEQTTWHEQFARCDDCEHATVGTQRPYAIHHLEGCSMPPVTSGSSRAPMTPEHTMTGAARLREALEQIAARADLWRRDEAPVVVEMGDLAREALAAVPEAPEPVYEWEYKTADWLAPNLIATHRRKVGPWERVEEGTER